MFSPWIWLKNGYTFADHELLLQTGVDRIITLIGRYKASWFPSFQLENNQALFGCKNSEKPDETAYDWKWPLGYFSELAKVSTDELNPFNSLKFDGGRILFSRSFLELLEEHYSHFSLNDKRQFETNLNSDLFLIAKSGRKLPNIKDTLFHFLLNNSSLKKNSSQAGLICEWYLSKNQNTISNSPIAKVWNDIIRQPLISYSLESRKKELAHAYKELADEIYRWETKLKKELEEKTKLLKHKDDSPHIFFRATQIKKYLGEQGITRQIRCRKISENYSDTNTPDFLVFLVCKNTDFGFSEPIDFKAFNPFEPSDRNVRYDMTKISDYERIQDLLKNTNATVASSPW